MLEKYELIKNENGFWVVIDCLNNMSLLIKHIVLEDGSKILDNELIELKKQNNNKGIKMKKIGDTCLFEGIEYGLGCVTDVKIGLSLLKKYGVNYRIFLSPLIELEVLKKYEKYLNSLNRGDR